MENKNKKTNKIGKVMFVLMTAILLVVTMVPLGSAGFDEEVDQAGDLVGGYTIYDTTDESNAVITVELELDNDIAQNAEITLTGVIGGGSDDWTGTIPVRNGDTFTVDFIASRVLGNDYTARRDPYDVTLNIKTDESNPRDDDVDDNGVDGDWTVTEEIHVNDFPTQNREPISGDIFEIDAIEDDLYPNELLEVEIEIDADEDGVNRYYDDMKIEGYLWDTVDKKEIDDDETFYFDLGDETETTKTLRFRLPEDIDLEGAESTKDRYEVRITVTADSSTNNANHAGIYEAVFDDFEVELHDYSVRFLNTDLSSDSVDAGESVIVTAEFVNNGLEDLSNLDVTAEIEDLGSKVSGSYTEMSQGETIIWTAGLGIRADAPAGDYVVEFTVEDEKGKAVATATETITVGAGGVPVTDNLDISIDANTLEIDEKTDVEVTNNGDSRVVVELKTGGADAELSESILTLEADETATVTLTANEAGDVTVYAETEDTVADTSVTVEEANVVARDQVVKVLQWIFAVIIIIAIILVIVWAVTKGRNQEGEKEAYY